MLSMSRLCAVPHTASIGYMYANERNVPIPGQILAWRKEPFEIQRMSSACATSSIRTLVSMLR